MAVISNVLGLVRGIKERQQNAQIKSALSNYLTDPNASIAAVNQIDPTAAIALERQHTADMAAQTAAANAAQDRKQKLFGGALNLLHGLPQGSDVGAALDTLAPTLKNQGYTDDDIASVKTAIAANPNLPTVTDEVAYKAANTPQVVAPGSVVTMGGKPAFRNPYEPKFIPQGSDKTGYSITTVDPNAPVGGTSAPAGSAGRPVNNAGAMRYDGTSQWQGMVGNPKPGDFLQFDTPENGDRAAIINIQNQAKLHGINTLTGLISKYAPAGDGSNNPAQYAATVGKALGINPNAKLDLSNPVIAERVYRAGIIPVENVGSGGAPSAGTSTVQTIKPAAQNTVRAATPQEIQTAGYPAGTAAQVDSTGKFVNLKVPSVSGAKGTADPVVGLTSTLDALNELDHNLADLKGDKRLSTLSGLTGHIGQYFPAGEAVNAKLSKINAQKLVALAQSLKAGGNPFSRITNMEAAQLPKTLAVITPGMPYQDMLNQIDAGREQLARSRQAVINEGIRQGIVAVNPKSGAMVMFNGRGWVPLK